MLRFYLFYMLGVHSTILFEESFPCWKNKKKAFSAVFPFSFIFPFKVTFVCCLNRAPFQVSFKVCAYPLSILACCSFTMTGEYLVCMWGLGATVLHLQSVGRCHSTVSLTAPLLTAPLLQVRNPKPVFFFRKSLVVSSGKRIWFLSWSFYYTGILSNVTRYVSFSLSNLQINLVLQPRKMFQLFVLAPPSIPFSSSRIPSYLRVGSPIAVFQVSHCPSLRFCSEF